MDFPKKLSKFRQFQRYLISNLEFLQEKLVFFLSKNIFLNFL